METGGIFGTVIMIGLLILAVLALFMPVFVMQIRDRARSIDNKLSQVIELLSTNNGEVTRTPDASLSEVEYDKRGRKIKICPSCGRKNRGDEYVCTNCAAPL